MTSDTETTSSLDSEDVGAPAAMAETGDATAAAPPTDGDGASLAETEVAETTSSGSTKKDTASKGTTKKAPAKKKRTSSKKASAKKASAKKTSSQKPRKASGSAKKSGSGGDGEDGERVLYTLTEVSEKIDISMPTLQRYKKHYQDRLPTVGEGRTQRYPEEALPVFEQIKKERISRRGRPRKSSKKKSSKRKSSKTDGLLTLTEVAERTNISYPTLVRYVKLHRDRIPFEGEGRRKRYHPEAVAVFQEIRSESRRGRRKKSTGGSKAKVDPSLARRVKALEHSQAKLEKKIDDVLRQLKKPLQVTIKRG